MTNHHLIKKQLKEAQELLLSVTSLLDPPPEIYTEAQVKDVICMKYEVSPEQLEGKNKKGKLEYARPAWALLLYTHVTNNKTEVSRCMGRKSHSGAIDFINRANDLIDTSKTFKAAIDEMRAILRNKYGSV